MLSNKVEDKLETLLSKSEIPIIDLAHCGTEESPLKSVVVRVGGQLSKALSEKGMALLVNHGISEEKLKMAYTLIDEFGKLPEETRELYMSVGGKNHGYVKPGQVKFQGQVDEIRHTFNICNLSEESPMPDEAMPNFRGNVVDLVKDFKSLTSLILQALATALDLPQTFFTDKHEHILEGEDENISTFRMVYYPPFVEEDEMCELVKGAYSYAYQRCTRDGPDLTVLENLKKSRNDDLEVRPRKITRCGARYDYGTFTLLSQDNEGGLEVKLPGSEKWKRVGHLPGAIIINAGELLSLWTHEKYPSVVHRVIIPEQVSVRSRGRHSLAFFIHPDNCTPIEPIEMPSSSSESCDKKPKSRVKSFKTAKTKIFNAYQHVQRRFKETYAS